MGAAPHTEPEYIVVRRPRLASRASFSRAGHTRARALQIAPPQLASPGRRQYDRRSPMMLLLASGFFAIPREQQAAHCLPVLFECSKSSGCNADAVQEDRSLSQERYQALTLGARATPRVHHTQAGGVWHTKLRVHSYTSVCYQFRVGRVCPFAGFPRSLQHQGPRPSRSALRFFRFLCFIIIKRREGGGVGWPLSRSAHGCLLVLRSGGGQPFKLSHISTLLLTPGGARPV